MILGPGTRCAPVQTTRPCAMLEPTVSDHATGRPSPRTIRPAPRVHVPSVFGRRVAQDTHPRQKATDENPRIVLPLPTVATAASPPSSRVNCGFSFSLGVYQRIAIGVNARNKKTTTTTKIRDRYRRRPWVWRARRWRRRDLRRARALSVPLPLSLLSLLSLRRLSLVRSPLMGSRRMLDGDDGASEKADGLYEALSPSWEEQDDESDVDVDDTDDDDFVAVDRAGERLPSSADFRLCLAATTPPRRAPLAARGSGTGTRT